MPWKGAQPRSHLRAPEREGRNRATLPGRAWLGAVATGSRSAVSAHLTEHDGTIVPAFTRRNPRVDDGVYIEPGGGTEADASRCRGLEHARDNHAEIMEKGGQRGPAAVDKREWVDPCIDAHRMKGEDVTGLLYVREDTSALHGMQNTAAVPFNALGDDAP